MAVAPLLAGAMPVYGPMAMNQLMSTVLNQQRQDEVTRMFGGLQSPYDLPENPTDPTQKALRDELNKLGSAVQVEQEGAVDRGFADALAASRQNLARQGLTGGSVAAQGFKDNLSQFITGKQQAKDAGTQASRQAQGSLNTMMNNLRVQAASGIPTPQGGAQLQMQLDTIREAKSNVNPSAIGSLFTTAGNTYMQDQMYRGMGRRGFSLSAPSTPSTGTNSGSR